MLSSGCVKPLVESAHGDFSSAIGLSSSGVGAANLRRTAAEEGAEVGRVAVLGLGVGDRDVGGGEGSADAKGEKEAVYGISDGGDGGVDGVGEEVGTAITR